jgi:hypothetical protein
MIRRAPAIALIAAALLTLPVKAQQPAAPAELPQLSLEQTTVLRCATAFALGEHMQRTNAPEAAGWPPLAVQGREFFVQSSARLMDEAGLSREQIAALVQNAGQELAEEGQLVRMMPACLQLAGIR